MFPFSFILQSYYTTLYGACQEGFSFFFFFFLARWLSLSPLDIIYYTLFLENYKMVKCTKNKNYFLGFQPRNCAVSTL